MFKTIALTALFLTTTTISVLSADLKTGNGLAATCKPENPKDYEETLKFGECLGFVVAIAQVTSCGNSIIYGYSSNVPSTPQLGQLVKIVKKWLDANPEKLHINAASLVATALSEVFPCP